MHGGKAQRDASLYSILVHRLNYLLYISPASTFEVVEPVLLRWVLTSESPLTSSLALDVLCFLVRVTPVEVGWNLTLATTELFQRVLAQDEKGPGGNTLSSVAWNGLKVAIC